MDVETVLHRLGVGLGAIVLGAGTVLLFAPGLAGVVPLGLWVADVAALVAILLGLWVVRSRYRSRSGGTVVPDVEYRLATPSPGDDLDDIIYRLTELREGTIEYRERIRRRVGDLAVSAIRYRQGCSREDALDQLEEGTWSGNAAATSFFTDSAGPASRSLLAAVLDRVSTAEHPYTRQLRETLDAIETAGGFDGTATESTDGSSSRGLDPNAVLGDGAGGIESKDEGEDEREEPIELVQSLSLRETHHWTGISAFGLVALAVGVLTSQPALLLASAVAVGLAGYVRLVAPPPVTGLDVTRTVDDDAPHPGDEIDVIVTVENTGDAFFPDLTLVDRVPPTMEVVDGTARLGTALPPGGTATFGYTAVAARGEHTWPLQAIARDAAGAAERDTLIDVETTVRCAPRLKTTAELPVRMQTSVYAGNVETGIGGAGLEFHATRDYQPGDPEGRIDWKTYARTRDLSTVEFREERAAQVVLLFDGRAASYVSTAPERKHALDRAVEAAVDVYASLDARDHLVGIAAFNGIPCWLAPDTGRLHRERVRQLFVDHPALTSLPPDLAEEPEGRYIDPMTHVRRRLPANAQVVLFSPLTDEYAADVARQLDGAGHRVTVVSPDPTTARTLGQRIVSLERATLIRQLREHGVRVVDWGDSDRLPLEFEHATRRWTA